ncbi:hypothetical protein DFH06DRAFT_1083347 [Mycena polygramma]|nr:hypothetical protein DFH06DRAFT_1083347 [Mycena polygramma]
MGQDWKIVNLDKRVAYGSILGLGIGKLGEFFFDGATPKSLESCLWPRTMEPNLDAVIPRFKPGERYKGRAGLYFPKTAPRTLCATVLVNLPVEMVHEIVSYLDDDLCDLLCLSATCQVLWEVGREHIYRHIAALVASYSWVGDRIICVGDYLRNDDIPEKILTPSERTEFSHYVGVLDGYFEGADEEESADSERSLYGYPFRQTEPSFDQHRMLSQCGIYDRFDWERIQFPNELDIIIGLFRKHKFAPERPRVFRILRNLTRLQYVRELVLLELSNEYPKVGFGEVVLSRICLSSDPSISMAYEGALHRGVWAGDRFDIVPAEWLEELGEDPSWTDVSAEVVEEMERICEADYW